MQIIPAISILDGRLVSLYKASFEQKSAYFKSPIHMAKFFEKEGAKSLHVVDLNPRKKTTPTQKENSLNAGLQRELLQHLLAEVKIPVQLEASFHSLAEIQDVFDLGIACAIIRPFAFGMMAEALQKFGPEKIWIEIQAKGSDVVMESQTDKVITSALPEETAHNEITTDIVDFAEKLVPLGVKNIIYKDERSEGTLIHPNYDEIDRLIGIVGQDLNIYLSGGIGELKHLALLKKIGTTGAIIGKAFYEGKLSLKEAREIAE